ncbi:hypothetical protein NEF87_002986 [Candidatus Lokiarchaeum ossiferum]|uniref:Phosphatidic acid phosphatase type 2/haloperoxidase domain-containing protein n=1 Tax=Candidatus Lokiarchaeum ossiferum TaxID=2951803 RepID=A0ABY6HTG0_9ARCH|nr:hypothetical protein NEF87_002986 [Candidatus Lokiarchaeum sp. B-35]
MEEFVLTELTYEPYHKLSRTEFIINLAIAALVLITGIILLALNLNESFDSSNEALVQIFEIITLFGDEELYIVFFAVFYFGIDKKFAKRLLIGFLISLHLTDFGKTLFKDPRPLSNDLRGEDAATGYGFPSGHSSGTLSFWGYTFFNFKGEEKKKGIPWQSLAIFLIIAVPISRLIIGVHDLQDVIGGIVVGFIVITLYMFYAPRVREVTKSWSMKKQIGIGVTVSVGLWILSSLLLYLVNFADGIDYLKDAFQQLSVSCALMCGGAIAFPLEVNHIKYDPRPLIWWKKLIAIAIGFALTFGIFLGAGFLFDLFPSIYFITRFIKYGLMMIIAGLAVPWLLKKIFKQ